jgi:hypothetical protein
MTPTLFTSCNALPPEGAAAPAAWQSQFRGPCLPGGGAASLPAAPGSLRTLAFGTIQ